ncbi:two-component regulator propeller domain-containing protein [Bacteroidota bacterium]
MKVCASQYLSLLFLLLTCQFTGYASEINTDFYARFRNLSVNDGLPDNHITALMQDEYGFIWIGTRNGLARYDGIHLITYRQNSDSLSLSDNYITDIAQGPDKRIWIATRNGLNVYNRDAEHFIHVPLIGQSGKGISHPYVRAILVEDESSVWIETIDGNLHQMNSHTFEAKLYHHKRIVQEYYDYHTIYSDSEGLIWVGGRNLGPMMFDPRLQEFTEIENDPQDPDKKRDEDVAFYFEDSRGQFWMGATDGAYVYDRDEEKFSKLLTTSTYDILEDDEGYIWMATGGGIYRYDMESGNFTRYQNFESDPLSITDNQVNCIFRDRDGNIWAGTENGISIWFATHNSIKHYRHLPHNPNSLSDDDVSSFLEDTDGNVWVGTMGGGLNRYKEDVDGFEVLTREKGDLLSNRVSALYQDKQQNIWIGYWQGLGFQKMTGKNRQLTSYALRPDSRKADWYNSFLDYSDSLLLTGIWGASGLHLFNKYTGEFLDRNWRPRYHTVTNPVMKVSRNGSVLWMSSTLDLIHRFDTEQESFTAFRSESFDESNRSGKIESSKIPSFNTIYKILTTDDVSYIFTDAGILAAEAGNQQLHVVCPGNYWSGTKLPGDPGIWVAADKGLGYVDKEGRYQTVISSGHEILQGQSITCLQYMNSQHILLGTSEGIYLFNTIERKMEEHDPAILQHNELNLPTVDIIRLNDSQMVLTHQRGCTFFNVEAMKFSSYDLSNAFQLGLTSDIIHSAYQKAGSSLIWLATGNGIYTYEPESNHFTKHRVLGNTTVYAIEGRGETLYLGTQMGLQALNTSTNQVIPYNLPPEDILSSHLTSFLDEDERGYIWSGTTDKGVNRLDKQTGKLSHYFQGHGYHGNSALAYCETADGTIFVGGDSLNVFDRRTNRFLVPDFAEQIPDEAIQSIIEYASNKIYIVSLHHIMDVDLSRDSVTFLNHLLNLDNVTFSGGILKRKNGEILFGSNTGYFSFVPGTLDDEKPGQRIQVTSIDILGEKQFSEIRDQKKMVFDHNQNFFQIAFSEMDFASSEAAYAYKLVGVDKNWVRTTGSSASYTKVKHGNYTFKVKLDGDTEEKAFQFSLVINPPFHATWWFRSGLLIIVIAVVVYWWYQRLLKVKITERNLDLKQRLLLSQMNPHFMYNTLTAIQGYIYKKDSVTAGSYLSKFAKLMRLYLHSMSTDYVSLQKEMDALTYYLELQKVRFDNIFDFEISVECEADYTSVGFPSLMIQPFVENAVLHGMREMKEGGFILCRFVMQDEEWKICISDNGSGIRRAAKDGESKNASMSTKIGKERLATLSRQYKSSFTLKITDLSEINSEKTGTMVEMNLPIINSFESKQ